MSRGRALHPEGPWKNGSHFLTADTPEEKRTPEHVLAYLFSNKVNDLGQARRSTYFACSILLRTPNMSDK